MTGLVVFNEEGQDTSLSVALYAAMKEKGWETNDAVPLSFTKDFPEDNGQVIRDQIMKEVEEAVYNAEWSKVKYVFSILAEKPVYGQSS